MSKRSARHPAGFYASLLNDVYDHSVDEYRERLSVLFERGLKSLLASNETITMRHDVLRSMFPDIQIRIVLLLCRSTTLTPLYYYMQLFTATH